MIEFLSHVAILGNLGLSIWQFMNSALLTTAIGSFFGAGAAAWLIYSFEGRKQTENNFRLVNTSVIQF